VPLQRWARDHRRVARDSLIHVSHRIWATLLVWLLIGIALALPGGFYLVQRNLALVTEHWGGRPGISAYLHLEANSQQANSLRDELAKDPDVERVTLITAADALAEFGQLSGVADALSHLDRNPLPASLRLILKTGSDPAVFDSLATRLRAEAIVDEVNIEKTWLERVRAMTEVVQRLGLMLAVTFAVGAVLVTAASVRLAIESRLDEIRVVKLVGANHPYVRRPFLYLGLIYGLGGGIGAAMLISVAVTLVESPLASLLGSYGGDVRITGLDAAFFAELLLAGGLLGVAGALVAARQRLANLQVI
jgi:cell division transport system permease protein